MLDSSPEKDGKTDDSADTSESTPAISDEESVGQNALNAKKQIDDYYKRQNEILESFKQDSEQIEAARRTRENRKRNSESDGSEAPENVESRLAAESKDSLLVRHEASLNEEKKLAKAAARLANITLLVNFLLMIAKCTASYLSGSMSIISSMVDSIVDLTSGAVLSVSVRMIRKRDPYQYPRGRTRVEPLALILISVIMGMASVQLIISSCSRLYAFYSEGHEDQINVSWPTIGIMLTTIAVKFTLYLICQKYKSDSSIKVLALDHRNDCLSNSIALLCAWLAYNYSHLYFLDPVGAIGVSIYILYTWLHTGYIHFLMLSGKSARPELIKRIIHQSIEHDQRITHIDTVYVYHYGTKFLVEVHIVLDRNMSLKETHDIAESLQTGLESLGEVERAFVHCDYEFGHHPHDEHKSV